MYICSECHLIPVKLTSSGHPFSYLGPVTKQAIYLYSPLRSYKRSNGELRVTDIVIFSLFASLSSLWAVCAPEIFQNQPLKSTMSQ